jgi:hypothetical protein
MWINEIFVRSRYIFMPRQERHIKIVAELCINLASTVGAVLKEQAM